MSGALWSGIIAAALGAIYMGIALDYGNDLVVNLVTVMAGALLLLLERLWPEQTTWSSGDSELWNDIGHFFAGFALGSFGGVGLAQALFPTPAWHLWPTSWPVPAQIALGLVMAEFFIYWQHRLVHAVPALWFLHMLHHSSNRMTFLKTTRIHALDLGSALFLSTAPLLAVGAPLPVMLWVGAFGNFAAQLQHANVRLRTPAWLNRVFGTPATHWLHHSIDLREGNSNFGMNLMLWDHVFGTYIPPAPEPQIVLGIEPNPVPPGFIGQLLLPWQAVRTLRRR